MTSPLSSAGVRGAALVVVWSSGFIGAELGSRWAPAGTLLAWRCLVTAVLLAPWLRRALRELTGRQWVQQAVLGLLCQALYLAGVFQAAAAGVPAGTSALVTSLQPALVVAVGALAAGRRPPGAHVVGLALGTAGVVLTAAADLGAGTPLPALALPLGAMVSLTVGTLLQERWSGSAVVPVLPALAVQSLVAAGFAVGVALPAGELAPPAVPGFWLAVGWAVLAGTGGYGLYAVVTARDGAARASTLLYLTPAVTTLWAVPFFGRSLPALTLVGLGAGLVAVALLRRGRRCSERVALPSTG